jgi:2-polyprenyl-3-methyl-5-hydroxy-6-metoxy-1,4-benzoquinol methylase
MEIKMIKKIAQETIFSIQKMDFSQLDISEYNKKYINRLLPHLDYCFDIYTVALIRLLPNEVTSNYFVDFGGGHGFLSLFLKRLGFNVIYCDINPLSVETITLIKNEVGYGPDIILEGSSPELVSFCKTNNLLPSYLISTDLIEHVYDLNALFADFYLLNPNIQMAFTTGSVYSNLLKSKKLQKAMLEEDKNIFSPMRKQFLLEKFPNMESSEIEKLAKLTRGLIFPDIIEFVNIYIETETLPVVDIDRYNTCDPETGNWSERILSKKQYRKIINANHFQVRFKNGFYNVHRNNCVSSMLTKIVNFFVRNFGLLGSKFAPFIILIVKKNP